MESIQASPMSLHFILDLEATDGTVDQCADAALLIARKLGVTVRWSHNGIKCHVNPYGSTEKLMKSWEKAKNSLEKNPWVSNV